MVDEKKLKWKEVMVAELSDVMKGQDNFYISNFVGLKSEEMNELRRSLEESSSKYVVLKNSIARIAFKSLGITDAEKMIEGGTGIIFTGDDVAHAARIIAKFSKAHAPLKIKGGYIDGALIDGSKVKYLASLPSREDLIATVVYTLKAPISGFVGVLSNTLKSLLFVVQAIKEKKGGQEDGGRTE